MIVGHSNKSKKLHFIEWIAAINCSDENEKRELENNTNKEVDHLFNMSFLLIEDEINLR